MSRLQDVKRFYALLDELERRLGGKRTLAAAHRNMTWPQRGVYFFFEAGEERSTSGTGARVVRVGAHAVSQGSKTNLWNRLNNHKGSTNGGNHRGSIFRLHVGTALIATEAWPGAAATWAVGQSAPPGAKTAERSLELRVNEVLGRMPFLWLNVDDEPSKDSLRAYLERNSIALLSNANTTPPIDPPSPSWLGLHAASPKVRQAGLWNIRHTTDTYEPEFLDVLEQHIKNA